jgi:hypothetical protein
MLDSNRYCVHGVATDRLVVLSAYKTQLGSCYRYPTAEQYKWCAEFEKEVLK